MIYPKNLQNFSNNFRYVSQFSVNFILIWKSEIYLLNCLFKRYIICIILMKSKIKYEQCPLILVLKTLKSSLTYFMILYSKTDKENKIFNTHSILTMCFPEKAKSVNLHVKG